MFLLISKEEGRTIYGGAIENYAIYDNKEDMIKYVEKFICDESHHMYFETEILMGIEDFKPTLTKEIQIEEFKSGNRISFYGELAGGCIYSISFSFREIILNKDIADESNIHNENDQYT